MLTRSGLARWDDPLFMLLGCDFNVRIETDSMREPRFRVQRTIYDLIGRAWVDGRTVSVAWHPDDEVMGTNGVIGLGGALLVEAGIEPTMALVELVAGKVLVPSSGFVERHLYRHVSPAFLSRFTRAVTADSGVYPSPVWG